MVGVPESRIQRRGLADNYWHMGVPGPGGPCSEIYYDRGPEYGREGGPEADEDRYLEVWNLVFMQYQLSAVRSKVDFDVAGDLPSRNIDTGMGMERMAALLQGVDNIYEIDTMWKVLDRAAELTETRYGVDHRTDVALRVVTDHVRTSVMLVADGVIPANEGRGYVLRRILRRSVQKLRLLSGAQRGGSGNRGGEDDRFLHELTSVAISALGRAVPGADQGRAEHPHGDRRGRDRVPRHAAHRQRDLRRGGRGDQAAGRARPSAATRPSSCTTRTASRSTSPSRWPPSRASRSTRSSSAG